MKVHLGPMAAMVCRQMMGQAVNAEVPMVDEAGQAVRSRCVELLYRLNAAAQKTPGVALTVEVDPHLASILAASFATAVRQVENLTGGVRPPGVDEIDEARAQFAACAAELDR